MRIEVEQQGNALKVKGSDFTLTFDVDGVTLPEIDPSFALWALLPIMMRRGEPIAFAQPIDPAMLANARRLVDIFAMWYPDAFRAIAISAPAGWQPASGPRNGELLLYSGGIDSTHTIVARGPQARQGSVLTVLGMDYHLNEAARFRRLLATTEPLLTAFNYRRLVVTTNFRTIWRGAISNAHAFLFASCQFIFKPLFRRSIMSADCTAEHDMVSFDSSNHVTNKYFAGTDFRMETAGVEFNRTDKIGVLARRPQILPALAFCTDKGSKPENCGRCSKCIRTKAMFLGMSGTIPPIFADMVFSARHVARINTAIPRHYMFFAELARAARREGHLDLLPGVEGMLVRRNRYVSQMVASWNRLVLWIKRPRGGASRAIGRDGPERSEAV